MNLKFIRIYWKILTDFTVLKPGRGFVGDWLICTALACFRWIKYQVIAYCALFLELKYTLDKSAMPRRWPRHAPAPTRLYLVSRLVGRRPGSWRSFSGNTEWWRAPGVSSGILTCISWSSGSVPHFWLFTSCGIKVLWSLWGANEAVCLRIELSHLGPFYAM